MKEKEIEEYLDGWLLRQNTGCEFSQRNLFKKEEYLKLLQDVLKTMQQNKDKSLEELREILYENSQIEDSIKHFINDRKMAPGLVVSYGTSNYQETLVIGNKKEVEFREDGKRIEKKEMMDEDTIFDLASITKLFTSLSILKCVQYKILKLDDKVKDIVPEFKNLENVTVFDLLAFQVPLKTNKRIDKAANKEEAENILFNIEIDQDNNNLRPYTDMGAMVLKYVIEKVSGMSYYEFLEKAILKPNGLENTYANIPESKKEKVAATSGDGFYYKDGNYRISETPGIGVVYDPKARIMDQEHGNLSGHAGLFSNSSDMTTLAKQLMNYKILKDYELHELAKNRTGRKYKDNEVEKYIQYLGYLCYSKNPNQPDSEVYHALSGEAFASAGWTGTQLTVDQFNKIYFFLGGNRSHNRMTYIDPIQKEKIKSIGEKKIITLPNGIEMIDATRFAWDRDEAIVHKAIRLTIEYKMLEDMVKLSEKEIQKEEKTRHI